MLFFHFIIGGIIVAGIPELAKRLGALFLTGSDLGIATARATALSALWGLLPLALFLLAVLTRHA